MATRILILFLVAGALMAPDDLSSCGPFLPQSVFTTSLAPLDESRFFAGQLDILQPHYKRIYLMAAYRYLTGIGLSQEDQQAMTAQPSVSDFWYGLTSSAVDAWVRARVTIGAPATGRIEQFKLFGQATYILNCGDDAFRNAAATLAEHAAAGASHDDLRAWVAAQDQVFSNCAGSLAGDPQPAPRVPSIPQSLPAGAAPWMQADRAYQIAAAEFYAGQFDLASADFLRIAADRTSPWHGIAPYLAARALIRKATLVDSTAIPAAQAQLRKVVDDPDAALWHESARGLERYLRAQTEPGQVLDELAHMVATGNTGVAGTMVEYRLMLDRFDNRSKEPPRDEDITDWMVEMRYSSGDRALQKWRATGSLPWLVAALTYAGKPHPDLMAAASQVPRSSPAFLTVEFHRLRLLPPGEARPGLDAILRRKLSPPARNMFLGARMRLARGWDELLHDAPRAAVATNYGDGAAEVANKSRSEREFDGDAADILDRQATLAVLLHAATNPDLPPNLQLRIAQAAWVRSLLLDDARRAQQIAPLLASRAPQLKPYLDTYLAAPDDKARAFAAAWLLLHNPGMRPAIDAGGGRLTPIPKIDNFRDNWWCPLAARPAQPITSPLGLLYQGAAPAARFLSPAQVAAAHREWEGFSQAPAATTYMARQAVEWADAHPNDPRVPEALHLVVRAAHFACGGDRQTDRWVKRAFRLLHGRYPNTNAARQTPLWYHADNPAL